MSSALASSKLSKPNILIVADKVVNQSEDIFVRLKAYIQELLGKTSYTIYSLAENDLRMEADSKTNAAVWRSNCVLLVTQMTTNGDLSHVYADYVRQGGRILSVPMVSLDGSGYLSGDITQTFEAIYENDTSIERADIDELAYKYLHKPSLGIHLILKVLVPSPDEDLNEKISNLLVDVFNLKRAGDDEERKMRDKLEKYHIFSKNQLTQSVNILKSYLERVMNEKAQLLVESNSDFDSNAYFTELKAKKFGTALLFAELAETTMLSIKELPQSIQDIVVLARRQTSGQGNNKNEWLSPKGCCMFTIYINLDSKEFSTSRLSLMQFAAALSCVKAVKKTPGYERLPIGIKWPNDIYFDERLKLGGVLVKSSLLGNKIALRIGVGINLSNQHPTECLNKVFLENNLTEWSTERFLAKFMNHFEDCFNLLKKPQALSSFLADCEDNWIHKNKTVRVNYWNEDVQIMGLNEHGYLRVKRTDNTEHCLQPDGNRFDLMENLILLRD